MDGAAIGGAAPGVAAFDLAAERRLAGSLTCTYGERCVALSLRPALALRAWGRGTEFDGRMLQPRGSCQSSREGVGRAGIL